MNTRSCEELLSIATTLAFADEHRIFILEQKIEAQKEQIMKCKMKIYNLTKDKSDDCK